MSAPLLVKVCGLTRPQDARLCLELGVDLTGFIFAAKSPRRVTPETVRGMPQGSALRVGVFVEQSVGEVLDIMEYAGLDLAQLHGGQSPEFCRAVGARRVIRVFWPAQHASPDALKTELERFAAVCHMLLLDAGTAGGGHGKTLDLDFLRGLQAPLPWLLAGGLGPDNIASALAKIRPHGVDLNSQVESAPGIKDHEKLRAALAAARGGVAPSGLPDRGSAPDPAGGG
jgi:phosphoribosylanthranilate isomerase